MIGTQEAVETLGGLLADPTLSHYARFALEPIPMPQRSTVFCAKRRKK